MSVSHNAILLCILMWFRRDMQSSVNFIFSCREFRKLVRVYNLKPRLVFSLMSPVSKLRLLGLQKEKVFGIRTSDTYVDNLYREIQVCKFSQVHNPTEFNIHWSYFDYRHSPKMNNRRINSPRENEASLMMKNDVLISVSRQAPRAQGTRCPVRVI